MLNQTHVEPPLGSESVERLQLTPGMKVADFGAGASTPWAARMSEIVGSDGQVILFDVRKEALATALRFIRLRNLTNCRGVWCNLEIYRGAQGVADNMFDAGILVNLLNESKHPKDILAEVHRMMKSGAKLMIVDWNIDTNHRLAPAPDRRMARDYIATLAQDLGFALVEQFEPSQNYWGLLLAKT